jgi:hypothetical protein
MSMRGILASLADVISAELDPPYISSCETRLSRV